MPAYYTWQNGDEITDERLNRIEQMSANECVVLIVSGGGGGGSGTSPAARFGGGGGGGIIITNITMSENDSFTVNIGAGGASSANGGASSIFNAIHGLISVSGGGSGGNFSSGSNGGSGGGGGAGNYIGGKGTYGASGGHGSEVYKSTGSALTGGGGGGAGGHGDSIFTKEWTALSVATLHQICWGRGGTGRPFFTQTYGGGGANGVVGSQGGNGQGADGPISAPSNGVSAISGYGGGGSGAATDGTALRNGGQGGSGVVIFAYRGSPNVASQKATGGSIYYNLGYIFHSFSGSGQTFTWIGV